MSQPFTESIIRSWLFTRSTGPTFTPRIVHHFAADGKNTWEMDGSWGWRPGCYYSDFHEPIQPNPVRRFLLISNALVLVVFTAFFAYTFLGRQHIDGIARSFVSAKTERYARPAVDMASEALQTELAQRLLTKDLQNALGAEIAEFRTDPTRFIQRLTAAATPEKPPAFLAKFSERVYGWKERIRAYYNNVLRRLFTDLRIFAGSNVVAAGIAFACAWRSPQDPSLRLKLCSALLLISVVLTAYLYIDSFSFFTILFNSYLGWWYPVFLGVVFFYLLLKSGDSAKATPRFDVSISVV